MGVVVETEGVIWIDGGGRLWLNEGVIERVCQCDRMCDLKGSIVPLAHLLAREGD